MIAQVCLSVSLCMFFRFVVSGSGLFFVFDLFTPFLAVCSVGWIAPHSSLVHSSSSGRLSVICGLSAALLMNGTRANPCFLI